MQFIRLLKERSSPAQEGRTFGICLDAIGVIKLIHVTKLIGVLRGQIVLTKWLNFFQVACHFCQRFFLVGAL